MQDTLNDPEDDKYEEEWEVIIADTKAKYTLSKNQARLVQEAFARKDKAVVFETFIIALPFVAEFYRVKRFLKGAKLLTDRATEEPYKPMDPEKWQKMKEDLYRKLGKKMPK